MIKTSITSLLLVLLAASSILADDPRQEWLEFFVGNWTRETNSWTKNGGWKKDEAQWSYELTAGGAAAVSKGKFKVSGDEWMLISSYDENRFHYERGVSSNGSNWAIDFELTEEMVLQGKAQGTINGEVVDGMVSLTRMGDDSYKADGEIKNAAGEVVLKVNDVNRRRQAADIKEGIAGWMKYLEGKWSYEISGAEEARQGEIVWSYEAGGKAMIGRITEGDTKAVEIGGLQADTQIGMVNGYGAEGDYWQLEYSEMSDKGGRGMIRGITEGVSYSAEFTVKIVDEDHWSWMIKGSSAAGEEVDLSASFKRG